jgi:Ca-activated chloride channel family protein
MIHKLLSFLALFILIGSQASVAQNRTFSVSSEEVRVDVLVTDNGKPISDLQTSDFEVFDNGVRQEIEYAKLQQRTPINAILVFDMSRSVVGELLLHLKDAARGLLSDFTGEDQAALITFNHAVVLGSPLTRDFSRINTSLDRTKPSGNSSLIDAGYAGLILAESGSELPFIIIFSDGFDTSSWLTGKAVLETAKRNDSVVYAISTHSQPAESFLNDLTELTGGTLFEVESSGDLASVFQGTLKEFRNRYLLAYTPRGVPEKGWHKLEVRVTHPSAAVRTRPGYMRSAPGE